MVSHLFSLDLGRVVVGVALSCRLLEPLFAEHLFRPLEFLYLKYHHQPRRSTTHGIEHVTTDTGLNTPTYSGTHQHRCSSSCTPNVP